MLIDTKAFLYLEEYLKKNGTIDRFEQEYGKIKGRMMITLCDIPEEYITLQIDGEQPYGFEASFDFYDSTVAFVFYPASKTFGSGLWVTPQKEGAESPSKEWIDFFVHTLVNNIIEDGGFGIPMYTFLSDIGDFTVVPAKPTKRNGR